MRDFYVVALLFSWIQGSYGCIPMHVDDPVVVTTTLATPTTTQKPDPCKGCVPPPIRSSGFPPQCRPQAAGTVSLSMIVDGDNCILKPTGCFIGYFFVLGQNLCTFSMRPHSPIKDAICKNGNFYYGQFQSLISYFVAGCSLFDI